MTPLLALGLSLFGIAVATGTARTGFLALTAAVEAAVVVLAVTGDALATAGVALLAGILAFLAVELAWGAAGRRVHDPEIARLRALEDRVLERRALHEQRLVRVATREARRTPPDERIAA